MNHKFKQICARLASADPGIIGSLDFESICEEYGAEPKLIDNMFYDTFGMSGEELIDHYRNG